MYILRGQDCSYQICNADDVRRPRSSPHRLDQRYLVGLARSLCSDEANHRLITELVHNAMGRAASSATLYERFALLVTRERLVLREISPPDAYPLPDPNRVQPISLAELSPDDPVDEPAPRTWISVELVHAAGLSTERVELEVTTPSGREIHGWLSADGTWRSDDVDGGTSTVRLLDHPTLRPKKRVLPCRARPERGDIVWPVGSERRLDLRSAQHHRIVIVQPPQPYCPTA